MKKLYFLLIALFIYANANACTIERKDFCKAFGQSGNSLIISGEIISIDTNGIEVLIMDVLRGEETRDTIRIWDGIDFECNGIWSMAAANLGDLNDTLVIILPKITEKVNDWDVIGDYRCPSLYYYTTHLKLEQGIVKGLISGYDWAPQHLNLLSMYYDDFKSKIINKGDCSAVVSTKDLLVTSKIKVNNPFSDNLSIQLDEIIDQGSLRLISMQGGILLTEEINSQDRIDLVADNLPAGLYVLEIRIRGELPTLQKVMKL